MSLNFEYISCYDCIQSGGTTWHLFTPSNYNSGGWMKIQNDAFSVQYSTWEISVKHKKGKYLVWPLFPMVAAYPISWRISSAQPETPSGARDRKELSEWLKGFLGLISRKRWQEHWDLLISLTWPASQLLHWVWCWHSLKGDTGTWILKERRQEAASIIGQMKSFLPKQCIKNTQCLPPA